MSFRADGTRRKGHIPGGDPVANTTHTTIFMAKLNVSPAIPSTYRMPAVIDEQQGEDCLGSFGKLVEVWCDARGLPCARVSRRFTYTLARQLSGQQPLVDEGAYPVDVINGMQKFGVVPESWCPGDDPTVINEPMSFLNLEKAITAKVIDATLVESVGAARCAELRQLLAANIPVGCTMSVDKSYENWGRSIYQQPTSSSLGTHAQRIVGYTPEAFCIAGSWGTGVGDDGFFWIGDEFVGGELMFDLYALNFALQVRA